MKINSIPHEKCTGCTACKAVCKQNAISFISDDGLFSYPKIDEAVCSSCGICETVCPAIHPVKQSHAEQIVAAKSKHSEIHCSSQSGGVFYTLAREWIASGGKVFGAAFAEDWSVNHICVDEITALGRLQGSKYVQSNVDGIYDCVKDTLTNQTPVLFSGTPCQCAALIAYLGKHPEHLLLVDLICHGVPSPMLWKDFLNNCRKKYHGEIEHAEFRVHDGSRRGHVECITVAGKPHYSITYGQLFYSHAFLRGSCFDCRYKSFDRVGDLSIGDWVGGEKRDPTFWNNRGTSLVLINTTRGKDAWQSISRQFETKTLTESDAVQPPLIGSFSAPADKERILRLYARGGFDSVARKYGHEAYTKRFKRIIKKIIR